MNPNEFAPRTLQVEPLESTPVGLLEKVIDVCVPITQLCSGTLLNQFLFGFPTNDRSRKRCPFPPESLLAHTFEPF